MNSNDNSPPAAAKGFGGKLSATLKMVKIAHTVFAMPFALVGWAFAWVCVREAEEMRPEWHSLASDALPQIAKDAGFAGMPWLWTLIWVIVAMVGARSFAMAFNRIVDRKIDAENPRTAKREIPAGVLSLRFAWGFTLGSAALFCLACLMLNPRTLMLAPVALLVVGGYSLTKRFTALCHVVLGAGLALAPIGAWLAVMGGAVDAAIGLPFAPFGLELFGTLPEGAVLNSVTTTPGAVAFHTLPVLLGLGVVLWVAGFDIIYSLQDEGFDRERKLHSIPALLGKAKALMVSRVFHLLAWCSWLGAIVLMRSGGPALYLHALVGGNVPEGYTPQHSLGFLSFVGLALVGACLVFEHALVKPNNLKHVNAAFFTLNGVIGLAFGALIIMDLWV